MEFVDGPRAPDGRPLASAWTRVLARFLDGVILFVINIAIVAVLVSGDAATGNFRSDVSRGDALVASVLGLVIGFVWDPVFTALKGGTPMKLAFGMNVVRSADAGPVGWKEAIIRWGIVAVWAVIPVLAVVAPLLIIIVSLVFLFTKPLRRTVWDRVANTLVVDVR